MKLHKLYLVIMVCLILFGADLMACTTIIVSGRASPDGRPLLWKHRDSDEEQTKLKYFAEGKYPFIGLIDVSDTLAENVWIGTNSAGFSIMNSASYNLNNPDTCKRKDQEGIIMKLALMRCATLADFERMLDTMQRPYGVESNFGVIDAQGGAAYYETGNFGYHKIDVNDPGASPFGYIIHTNFSFCGEKDMGGGYIRYLTAEKLFSQAAQTNDLSVDYILTNVARSLQHSLTGVDLYRDLPENESDTRFSYFEDFIPRYISNSSVIIQGIKKGESPDLTTMWTIDGWPLGSVVFPVWVCGGDQLPAILTGGTGKRSSLCDWSVKLKKQCFPIVAGYGVRYILVNKLVNLENTGTLQKILRIEHELYPGYLKQLNQWRKDGISKTDVRSFYSRVEKNITEEFTHNFNLQKD